VTSGQIRFVPQRFERTYLHWMENIRDWCISRQIWWGHRIPVWYCDDCEHLTVAIEDPERCEGCGSVSIRQDEDTLDTWFSSGLWPHSTLGWPDDTEDLRRFYPTQVMETGYDIIFFWVARMIMLSLYNMRDFPRGSIPFETVYLHGLVRAPDGQKMSKSRGNVVDPLDAIEQYGTDALRYALLSGTSPGNDQRITDDRLEAGRNFANKLWNASRFVISMTEEGDDLSAPALTPGAPVEDRWVLSRVDRLVEDVDSLWERYELAEALRQVRDFFWDEFADWYIELAKVRLRAGDEAPRRVLAHLLERSLRLLHPFMPFITEELWQRVAPRAGVHGDSIMLQAYPVPEERLIDQAALDEVAWVKAFVLGVRRIRAERNMPPNRSLPVQVKHGTPTEHTWLDRNLPYLLSLGRIKSLDRAEEETSQAMATALAGEMTVLVPLRNGSTVSANFCVPGVS
jgi:valyl-tRNA synthetase